MRNRRIIPYDCEAQHIAAISMTCLDLNLHPLPNRKRFVIIRVQRLNYMICETSWTDCRGNLFFIRLSHVDLHTLDISFGMVFVGINYFLLIKYRPLSWYPPTPYSQHAFLSLQNTRRKIFIVGAYCFPK